MEKPNCGKLNDRLNYLLKIQFIIFNADMLIPINKNISKQTAGSISAASRKQKIFRQIKFLYSYFANNT